MPGAARAASASSKDGGGPSKSKSARKREKQRAKKKAAQQESEPATPNDLAASVAAGDELLTPGGTDGAPNDSTTAARKLDLCAADLLTEPSQPPPLGAFHEAGAGNTVGSEAANRFSAPANLLASWVKGVSDTIGGRGSQGMPSPRVVHGSAAYPRPTSAKLLKRSCRLAAAPPLPRRSLLEPFLAAHATCVTDTPSVTEPGCVGRSGSEEPSQVHFLSQGLVEGSPQHQSASHAEWQHEQEDRALGSWAGLDASPTAQRVGPAQGSDSDASASCPSCPPRPVLFGQGQGAAAGEGSKGRRSITDCPLLPGLFPQKTRGTAGGGSNGSVSSREPPPEPSRPLPTTPKVPASKDVKTPSMGSADAEAEGQESIYILHLPGHQLPCPDAPPAELADSALPPQPYSAFAGPCTPPPLPASPSTGSSGAEGKGAVSPCGGAERERPKSLSVAPRPVLQGRGLDDILGLSLLVSVSDSMVRVARETTGSNGSKPASPSISSKPQSPPPPSVTQGTLFGYKF